MRLDSDVPPLEDMSVMLQERASLQQQYQQKSRVSQASKAESTEYNKKEGNNVKISSGLLHLLVKMKRFK
jgi:hypothetical protein